MSMPLIELTLDVNGVNSLIDDLIEAGSDFSVPLSLFKLYHNAETIKLFMANAQGGTYRGVTWAYFKNPLRIRQTDGMAIPPWGGVPRLRAGRSNRSRDKGSRVKRANFKSTGREPNVRAVLRASGKRLKEGDAVMQDTRLLMHRLTTASDIDEVRPTSVRWGTALPYAPRQMELRPALFFIQKDVVKLEQQILKHFGLGG